MKGIIQAIILFPIKVYRACISPWFAPCCRHVPSCSQYTKEAIVAHGVAKGLLLSTKRLLSCHPWGRHGYDPVPPSDHTHS